MRIIWVVWRFQNFVEIMISNLNHLKTNASETAVYQFHPKKKLLHPYDKLYSDSPFPKPIEPALSIVSGLKAFVSAVCFTKSDRQSRIIANTPLLFIWRRGVRLIRNAFAKIVQRLIRSLSRVFCYKQNYLSDVLTRWSWKYKENHSLCILVYIRNWSIWYMSLLFDD